MTPLSPAELTAAFAGLAPTLTTYTTSGGGGVACSFIGDPKAFELPTEQELERAKEQRRKQKQEEPYSSLPAHLAAWLRSRPKLDRDGRPLADAE